MGLSVSRVGSAAQTKAMKKVAGQLKLGRRCAHYYTETPYRSGSPVLYGTCINGTSPISVDWLRARQENAPFMVRLTKLTRFLKIGEIVAPRGQITSFPTVCASARSICTGASGRVGSVCQRGVKVYKPHSKKSQRPKDGVSLIPHGGMKNTSIIVGTSKVLGDIPSKSGARVTDLTVWGKPTSALVCEAPQPDNFFDLAIKAIVKIKNVKTERFSAYKLAIALAKIDYYRKIANRNKGYIGDVDLMSIISDPSFSTAFPLSVGGRV